MTIQTIFPNFVLQQLRNCLAVRTIVPKGTHEAELIWTAFGYVDDDARRLQGRLKQANMMGPAGLDRDGRRHDRRTGAKGDCRRPRQGVGPRDGRPRHRADSRDRASPRAASADSGPATARSWACKAMNATSSSARTRRWRRRGGFSRSTPTSLDEGPLGRLAGPSYRNLPLPHHHPAERGAQYAALDHALRQSRHAVRPGRGRRKGEYLRAALLSPCAVGLAHAADDRRIRSWLETSFICVRTMLDGRMSLFAAGKYVDEIVDQADRCLFRSKTVRPGCRPRSIP